MSEEKPEQASAKAKVTEPEWFEPEGEPTKEQQYFSERIVEILNQKDDKGEYVYTNKEVRDFIVAATLTAGLAVNKEIGLVMLEFLAELEGPKEADTQEELLGHIRAYFDAHPLNKALQNEFFQWGRSELFKAGEGFKDAGRQLAAAKAAGAVAGVSAPQALPKKGPAPKVKKGISKD